MARRRRIDRQIFQCYTSVLRHAMAVSIRGRGRRRKLGFSSSPASPASRPYQATTYVGTFGLVIVTPSSRSASRPPIIAFRHKGQRTRRSFASRPPIIAFRYKGQRTKDRTASRPPSTAIRSPLRSHLLRIPDLDDQPPSLADVLLVPTRSCLRPLAQTHRNPWLSGPKGTANWALPYLAPRRSEVFRRFRVPMLLAGRNRPKRPITLPPPPFFGLSPENHRLSPRSSTTVKRYARDITAGKPAALW